MRAWKKFTNTRIHELRWFALFLLPLAAACQIEVNDGNTDPTTGGGGAPGGGGASGSVCGGRSGFSCAAGSFCDYALADICGTADAQGTCQPVPEGCTKEYSPVCGCDGNTYGNACMAHAGGVAVAAPGECAPPVTEACGGLGGGSCASGLFCNYTLEAICGAADATGVCEPIPGACDAVYDPVCGCDDVTYSNACSAHAASVAVAVLGECPGT